MDKESLYGKFQKHQDAKNNLAMKAAHKALDIADDDMNINVQNKSAGVGSLGLMGIALAAGLPGVLVAGAMLLKPALPSTPKSPVYDAVTEEQQPDGAWIEIHRDRLEVPK